jgi:hypothetical protein
MVLFGFVGVLLIALGIPLLRRRVRPNLLYGLRSRETLADEGIWYEANARLGSGLIALGAGLLLLALGLPLLPDLSDTMYALCCLAWLVLGVLALCIGTQRVARRMAAERPSG